MGRKPFDYEARLRELHAAGYTDSEIGKEVGRFRKTIGKHRVALGLKSNRDGRRFRDRVRSATTKRLRELGLKCLSELKQKAHREFAIRNGWPGDLGAREVTILNALLEHGPMTKRQLCETLGVRWIGSNSSLRNHYGVSYLKKLQERGLVVSLGKIVKSKDSSKASVCLFSLPVHVEPIPVHERTLK